MKYLIAGLGNIGTEYSETRHNIGFMVLDDFAKSSNTIFNSSRYCFNTNVKYKGQTFILIKPTTFMNLSGKAVKYWLEKEKIEINNLLVISDDIALPFGTIRIKPNGNNGGHNGLKNIDETLGTNNYARLRFGIGNNFHRGYQSDYVLSNFTTEEKKLLPTCIKKINDAILEFGLSGIQNAMNKFNGKTNFE